MKARTLLQSIIPLLLLTGASSQADEEAEKLMKEMVDKLNAAVKGAAKPIVVDSQTQAVLDEFDIELGGPELDSDDDITPSHYAEDLSSDPTGHGEPFGSVGPRASPVETTEASIKPTSFINRYLYKKRPVLLQGVLSASPALQTWDTAYLSNAPPSAMSNITAYDSSLQHMTGEKMSMRDFVMSDNKDLFVFGEIPSFLMKDLAFPRLLKCDVLLKDLKRHFLTYYKLKLVTEPVVMPDDRLLCSIIGKPSYVLVPSDSWQSLAKNETSINYSKINYNTHPWLKQLKYWNALQVQPADCLFVPGGWYVQSTYPDIPTLSVMLTWTPQKEKASKAICGKHDLKTEYQFEDYSSLFSETKVERKSSSDALIHYFVFYLGDQLSSSFTHKQFVRKLKRDNKLFAKLVNWTEEVGEISVELFEILDVNGDGKFSLADVVSTSAQDRNRLASEIQDRLQDLGAIMDEQQTSLAKEKVRAKSAESAAPAAKTKKKQAPATDDMAQEFKNELTKEMEKMIKELQEKEMKETKEAEAKARKTKAAKDQSKTRSKAADQSQKPSQQKKSSETKQSPNKDKYTLVTDDEVEILAEDDGGKPIDEIPGKSHQSNQKTQSSATNTAGAKASNIDKAGGAKATTKQEL